MNEQAAAQLLSILPDVSNQHEFAINSDFIAADPQVFAYAVGSPWPDRLDGPSAACHIPRFWPEQTGQKMPDNTGHAVDNKVLGPSCPEWFTFLPLAGFGRCLSFL